MTESTSEQLDLLLKAIADRDLAAALSFFEKDLSFQAAFFKFKNKNGDTILHFMAHTGDCCHAIAQLKLFDWRGAIDEPDNDQRTPLFIAAWKGHTEVVRLLLAKGARTQTSNENGHLPLHAAAFHGHLEVVELLLKEGLDQLNAQDRWRQTPLFIAAWKGHDSVVQLLLNKGAWKQIQDESGDLPLHAAAFYGHLKVVELLLKEGPDQLNAQDNSGMTPLHLAAKQGHRQIVRSLLNEGASITIQDKNNHTPLAIVTALHDTETAKLLVSSLFYWKRCIFAVKSFFKKLKDRCLVTLQKIGSFFLALVKAPFEFFRNKKRPSGPPPEHQKGSFNESACSSMSSPTMTSGPSKLSSNKCVVKKWLLHRQLGRR